MHHFLYKIEKRSLKKENPVCLGPLLFLWKPIYEWFPHLAQSATKIQAFILNPSSPIWNFRDLLWDILERCVFMHCHRLPLSYETHMEVNSRKPYIVYITLGTNMWLMWLYLHNQNSSQGTHTRTTWRIIVTLWKILPGLIRGKHQANCLSNESLGLQFNWIG